MLFSPLLCFTIRVGASICLPSGALFSASDRRRSILWQPYSKLSSGTRTKSSGLGLSDRDSDCTVSVKSNRSSFNSIVDYDLDTYTRKCHTSSFNTVSTLSDTQQLLVLESVLHLADVSNPAKPWKTYCRWLDCVMAEFYDQGLLMCL